MARKLDDYWTRRTHVVQPRVFSKAQALEVTGLAGVVPTDPLRTYVLLGGRTLYHVSEHWALGADFDYWLDVDGALLDELPRAGTPPGRYERERPRWRLGGLVQWTPLYGKLSAYGRVVHIDMHLVAGAGALHSASEPAIGAEAGVRPAFSFGLGFGVLIVRRWMVLFDYRQHLYLRPAAPGAVDGGGVGWPAAFQLGFGVLFGGRR